MSHPQDKLLIRLLAGELEEDEAEALRRAMASEKDGKLQARYRSLASTWESLSPPPLAPAPPTFRTRVMGEIREEAETEKSLAWDQAPPWVRVGAAAALLVGALSGAALTHVTVAAGPMEDELLVLDLLTLAESYVLDLGPEDDPDRDGVTP